MLIKMFQEDQTTLAIICIVLALCTGIGPLIALVVGWMNATKWRIQQVMLLWTGCLIGSIVLYLIGFCIVAASGVNANQNFEFGP